MEHSSCNACGGMMLEHRDNTYDIDYWMCFNCGRVIFNIDDGLGIKRLLLPKKRRRRAKKDSSQDTDKR